MQTLQRTCPVGAEVVGEGEAHFRVWAPSRRQVSVEIDHPERRSIPLQPEPGGYHSGLAVGLAPGTAYRYLLDGEGPFPDPASRFQPEGPHGASQVVDPRSYAWSDQDWRGVRDPRPVLYEMHLGTFTPEGSWDAAAARLPALRDLGVGILEIMPVAEFPGRFGWGYDGVQLFAPSHLYGRPDDFRRFVDQAHQLGLGVILDVVYNHFGPDGCSLAQFSPQYFHGERENEWGSGLNFDGPGSSAVREFFIANAEYWIREFHLDGLRFDATQAIQDASEEHLLAAIARSARDAAPERPLFLVAENEPQDTRLVRPPAEGGYGLDALWNDDFHHAARVALTGKREAYFSGYRGSAQEFLALALRGFLYQGQPYAWQQKRRGSPTRGVDSNAFVVFLENHDQVANSAFGRRLWQESAPGVHRALTALLLLGPGLPMLFQGQEFGSAAPFLYFADHREELAEAIRKGRRKFLAQFPSLASEEMGARLPDPCSEDGFRTSVLRAAGRAAGPAAWDLHRDLLALRRSEAAFHAPGADGVDGAVIDERSFLLRFREKGGDDRLLIVNLGAELDGPMPSEPLAAPPPGRDWKLLWSSENPDYGGGGALSPIVDDAWRLPGFCALLLRPVEGGD